ncbi:MAG TPA: aminoglycoside phosphotransferase family protein [Actinomycetota bacterium]|nr:aminoglycoside phosphotransferase family protein [Actinomycetota bacterium]
MERKPDIDRRALEAMLQRVLGPGLTVARTPSGVAAQMYRVQAAGRVVYARVAEDDHEDLSVDAALLERLGAMGLRVPRVVHVEPSAQAVGRSVLVMTEIAGEPLAGWRDQRAAQRVARAAGRDLGLLSRVEVRGFGWIRRQPPVWPLRATSPTYAEFVTSYLPDPWPGPLAALFTAAELEHLWALVDRERGRDLEGGTLAHGDFDRTHIFHLGGDYSGLIDFGEIRGAEPLFDLGHFALWEREGGAVPLLDDLLAGYGEVAALPAGHEELIGRSAILLGLRQLARWLGPPRRLDRGHPMVTGRVARLRRLLGSSGTGRIDPARPGSPR